MFKTELELGDVEVAFSVCCQAVRTIKRAVRADYKFADKVPVWIELGDAVGEFFGDVNATIRAYRHINRMIQDDWVASAVNQSEVGITLLPVIGAEADVDLIYGSHHGAFAKPQIPDLRGDILANVEQ